MDPVIYDDEGSFRDSFNTITKDGNRNWIFPKQPKGRYYNRRTIFSYFLLAVIDGKLNLHFYIVCIFFILFESHYANLDN
jgi:hypothetical protein